MSDKSNSRAVVVGGSKKHVKLHLRVTMLAVIAALILVAVVVGTLVVVHVVRHKNADKIQPLKAVSSNEAYIQSQKATSASRQAIYNSQPADSSVDSLVLNLRTQMVAAEAAGDYTQLKTFATKLLAIPGHENDIDALTELSLVYQKTSQTADYKATLQKLKAAYEADGQQDSYAYKNVVTELQGL